MKTDEFLKRVWPTQGLYYLLRVTPQRKRHYSFPDAEKAAEAACAWDRDGNTVYYALASYQRQYVMRPDPKKYGANYRVYRVRENVSHLRAMWLDLDVAPTLLDDNYAAKKYRTQREAFSASAAFVQDANLPPPSMVVSSGRGLHLYWTFTEDLPLAVWERIAPLFKSVCTAFGLKADPARTADPCSVLRPIGTTHRKAAEPLPVDLLIGAGEDIEFMPFAKAIVAAAQTKRVKAPSLSATPSTVNDDLVIKREFPPSSAYQIATSCAQIGHVATQRGNVEEPLWYAAIGVLRYCTESPAVIHEWSSGHPHYSASETDAKIYHHERSGTGPTTCARFADLRPDGCAGCQFAGKIKSPVSLGTVVEQAPAPVIELGPAEGDIFGEQSVTIPNPPAPYIRTKSGRLGIYIEGEVQIWCDYDIYPVKRLRDVSAGADTLVLRCDKKKDGIVTLTLPTAMIGNLNEFTTWLNKQGIYIAGKTVMTMQAYLMSYMKDLQARASHVQQYNQLGWKDDHTSFVLGHSTHRADGTSVDNTASDTVSTLSGFAKRGDLDTWRQVMALYERGGMEPYQFAVGIGFAAPLMTFSGYEGAVIAMVSPEGGQGKTTALHAINSIWGNPKDIGLQANDTPNAVLKRIGAYNNMPVTLDEVSNTTGQQLSDLAYQITQGRERRRLNSDSSEKKTFDRWSTILAVTANQSLLARLALYKTNSDAEVHRIVEYLVQNPMTVSKDEAEAHFPLLFEHYGTAGDIYAKWLVQNVPAVKKALLVTRQKLDAAAGISTKERYWSAVASAVITGVAIAKKLGLVGFDVQQLFNWTLGALATMRTKGADITRDTVSILAAYLNQFMGGRIVVKKSAGSNYTVLVDLRGTELIYRVEQDTGRIYLDRNHFRDWLARSGGDYHSLLMDLRSSGVLTRADGKRSLGQGTNYTTAVTTCLEIDMTHPKLSAQPVLRVVESETQAAQR